MTPKKPDWFELTENEDSYTGIQKINKKLPIATLVVAGAVILGGSIFANANNEQTAVAETPTTSQSVASQASSRSALTTSPKVTSGVSATSTSINPAAVKSVSTVNGLPMPVVTNVAQRDDDDEHEGRERGSRERDHDDDDDDRHEDEDDD
jgi:hypothetical protein